MSITRNLLVLGATGKQGGSTIKALLKSPEASKFNIYAVTRDPNSASSKRLAENPNVHPIKGDLAAPEELFKTAGVPIWGVMAMSMPGKKEAINGNAMVDAAVKNGVSHFVFTSVDRGGPVKSPLTATDIPHFKTKFEIEKHLEEVSSKSEGKLTYTILRPVAFLDNFTDNFIGRLIWRIFLNTIGEDTKIQQVATSDIGWFAAQALIHSDDSKYKNAAVGIAGDELTMKEMNTIFKEHTGKDYPAGSSILAGVFNWLIADIYYMFRWFRTDGYAVDVAAVRAANPEVKTFKKWLETESAWKR